MTQEEFLRLVFNQWEAHEDADINPEWRIRALCRLMAAEIMAGIHPSGHQPVIAAIAATIMSTIAEVIDTLPKEGDTIN